MAVRPPDDRRSLAAALAEQGPGPGNPTARMYGWRATAWRPADCGSPVTRPAPRSRLSLNCPCCRCKLGRRSPNGFCPKFARDQDGVGPARRAWLAGPRFESYLRSQPPPEASTTCWRPRRECPSTVPFRSRRWSAASQWYGRTRPLRSPTGRKWITEPLRQSKNAGRRPRVTTRSSTRVWSRSTWAFERERSAGTDRAPACATSTWSGSSSQLCGRQVERVWTPEACLRGPSRGCAGSLRALMPRVPPHAALYALTTPFF